MQKMKPERRVDNTKGMAMREKKDCLHKVDLSLIEASRNAFIAR